ncbi:MAG: hypothetical protein LBH97_06245, partial [Treponema sp.]|nr:hypothetical protein [Treponema sp.]
MQALMSLNDLYMQFIAGLLSKKELEGFIFRTIHENLCHYNLAHWKRDDCDDFLAWLYPRISRAIDSYHNNGASFDNYIAGMVRWSAKEYRACIADNNVFEYAVWIARFSDQYAEEQEPGYNVEEPVSATAIEQTKNPRQLLMLIL